MTDVLTLDLAGARRLTERIRLIAQNVSDNVEKLRDLVQEALAADVHTILGYTSWPAYLSEVLGEEPMRLERDVRKELSIELAAQGMSTRAIAPIFGVSREQIRIDIAGDNNLSPAPVINVIASTGEVVDPTPVATEPRTVIGLDGKSYPAPERKAIKPSAEVTIINDIRLYLRTLARSPQVARLSEAGKQHLINALQDTINQLERNQK